MDAARFDRGAGDFPVAETGAARDLRRDHLRERTDEQLMALWVDSRHAGRRDTVPFDILWERHRSNTWNLVTRVLGRRHRCVADEVFQDTWLEVARVERFHAGSFRSWVRTIATRKALDRLTAASVRNLATDDLESLDGDDLALVWTGYDPARRVTAREMVARVLKVVEQMPDAQRAAWVLKYVEQMTFGELAETMGIPVGTAKTRIRLANAFLAQALEEGGITLADLEEVM